MVFPVQPSGAGLYGGSGTRPAVEYSGTFIPEIWSGKLIEKFYDATVLAAMANTDYEGEIRNQGDTVKIRTRPSITIRNYSADQILQVERPSAPTVELLIDKGKYFNTVIDDVMALQSDIEQLSLWSDDATEQMKIVVDSDVLASIGADIVAENKGTGAGRISGDINLGTPAAPLQLVPRNPSTGETEVVDLIVQMGQVLDEQNVPESGRYLIVPAWLASLIKRSELRDASLTGDSMTMTRNGRLGMIDRFTLYVSNLLPVDVSTTVESFRLYAGHKHALTFASQLTKVETLRAESTFGTLLRGLQVYGYKVVDGIALVQANVQKAAP